MAGDATAREDLFQMALGALDPALESMIALLRASAARRVPGAAALRGVTREAIYEAIPLWTVVGDWVTFAIDYALAALWQAVESAFRRSALRYARQALASLHYEPGLHRRLAAECTSVAGEIIRLAPRAWLKITDAQVSWREYVTSSGALFFAVLCRDMAPGLVGAPIEGPVLKRIEALARKYARGENWGLYGDLVNAAAITVAKKWANFDIGKGRGDIAGRWERYALEVADNAMLTLLNPVRRHDLSAIRWRIEEALLSFREREKRDPTLKELLLEINPPWDRGDESKPHLSASVVCKVIAMFAIAKIEGTGKRSLYTPDQWDALATNARLTDLERAVMSRFLDGYDHATIAEDLGITEAKSKKVKFCACRKIRIYLSRLTRDEWRLLKLCILGGKSIAEIAHTTGSALSDLHMHFQMACEKIEDYPLATKCLGDNERQALRLALNGTPHHGIATCHDLPEEEVLPLLRLAVEKLEPKNHKNTKPHSEDESSET
jgi:hypothetical protein